jgi:hypothetical protein
MMKAVAEYINVKKSFLKKLQQAHWQVIEQMQVVQIG